MSSKRRIRRNGCTGKVAYKSMGAAFDVVRAMKREGEQFLNAYICPIRDNSKQPRHYHVGHAINANRAYVP